MIRHISLFRMESSPADGKTMEENIAALEAFLRTLPAQEPSIVGCRIAHSLTQAPELPDEAPVMFTQVVQMIDFLTPEDAAAYPESAVHQVLVAFTQGMVKKVVAIDFEI